MIKVKVEQLKKSFGSLEVLKGIDLEVKEGEVVCLIGPSGSGKSTFLRCLNKLEETTAGTVIVDDNDITDPKCNINKVRENIGMVFQQFNLFPHLNVLENIMLAPVDRKKLTKEEAKKTAYETMMRCYDRNIYDWGTIKNRVRDDVSKLMYERTKRSPMILPILMEV